MPTLLHDQFVYFSFSPQTLWPITIERQRSMAPLHNKPISYSSFKENKTKRPKIQLVFTFEILHKQTNIGKFTSVVDHYSENTGL